MRTIEDHRKAWREHCQPLIASGQAVIYGSPEYFQYLERKRAEKQALEQKRALASESLLDSI